ncbi:MAG: YihY/virulence factor BrkB family protein [Cryomorphaceae bacterium]|nr:YihY/virulence factor BrkB family protein [Cryomorphaceae bacterium]
MNASQLVHVLRKTAQNVRLPLFDGLSAYDVAVFFWKGIYEGSVSSRAASISFSFFLALFPGVIFLFTLIPFIPVAGFQSELFKLLRDVLPPNSFDAAYTTITDILTIKRGDLLSVTVLAAFFFATNGTLSLIGNFGQSIHRLNVRGFWSQYLAAFLLTLALSVLLIVGITVLTLSEVYLGEWVGGELGLWIAAATRWIVLLGLVLLSISLLFYFGPMRSAPWRFVSPGALLATLLVWLTSYLFGIYVTDFSQYNQLYGSIGTLMIIQLWLYVNAIGLIIGFELNASMAEAKNHLLSRRT